MVFLCYLAKVCLNLAKTKINIKKKKKRSEGFIRTFPQKFLATDWPFFTIVNKVTQYKIQFSRVYYNKILAKFNMILFCLLNLLSFFFT